MGDSAEQASLISRCACAFWQGLTRPHAGTALAALGLALTGWLFLAASSTEARVRATDTARWLRNAEDGWCQLNAVAIQGAARHAAKPGETVVLVGPSHLQALLPPGPALTDAFSRSRDGRPQRVVQLAAPALNHEEMAAVVEKFGGDFEGWFVLAVNRHTLARDLRTRDVVKDEGAMTLGFPSALLNDERRRAGLPVRASWGVPLLDYPGFYLASLGGWRHALGQAPVFGAGGEYSASPQRPVSARQVELALPAHLPEAEARNLGLLARVAGRLRAAGGARLAVVEVPFADEALPELQTTRWREQRAGFVRRREAWSRENGVPWLDTTAELRLTADDFTDPAHVRSPVARIRFAEAVSRWLAGLKP
jgi:hypothetical protein